MRIAYPVLASAAFRRLSDAFGIIWGPAPIYGMIYPPHLLDVVQMIPLCRPHLLDVGQTYMTYPLEK